jgi:hypothetical protein
MTGWLFNVDAFVLVAGLVFAGSWLLVGVARLQFAWTSATKQNAGLKQQQVHEAKELLKIAQEILRLEAEIKEARAGITAAGKQEAEKNKALVGRAAPAAPEIWVHSEFPASRRDLPWIAHLKRTGAAARTRPAGESNHRYVLVWAADHPGALGRARQLVATEADFEVEGLRRFDM